MSRHIQDLFDYQQFSGNSKLNDVLKGTESRYEIEELSLDDLEMISAAGSMEESLYQANRKGAFKR